MRESSEANFCAFCTFASNILLKVFKILKYIRAVRRWSSLAMTRACQARNPSSNLGRRIFKMAKRKNLFNVEKYSLPKYKIEEIKQKRAEELGLINENQEKSEESKGNSKEQLSIDEICERINAELDELDSPMNLIESEGIGEISASKLTTYKGCPFAYFLGYVMHLKPLLMPASIKAGLAMHNVIADFNRGNLLTLEDLINGREIIENGKKKKILGWKARWYRQVYSKDIYFDNDDQPYIIFNSGNRLLEEFYHEEKNNSNEKLLVEHRFCLNINLNNKSYLFTGVFDLIEHDGKKGHIIDYKTGSMLTKITADLSIQFTIYNLAYNELQKQGIIKTQGEPEIVLYYLPLFSKDSRIFKQKTNRDAIDIQYLVETIETVNKKIREKNFIPFIASSQFDHCKKCSWQLGNFCYDILNHRNKEIYSKLMKLKKRE